VISGARDRFRRLLWGWYLRMRSKCIYSTPGRKFIPGNGFSDTDFLHDRELLAARHGFSPISASFTAHLQFVQHYYFRFKIWRYIWIQYTRFPIKSRSFPVHDTICGDFCDVNICACAVGVFSSTSGHKFVTGNEFSDPDFPQDATIWPVNQRWRPPWAN